MKMAHPNCQISSNSPKKTPQSTPSKGSNNPGAENVEGNITQASVDGQAGTTGGSIPSNLAHMIPVTQKFGCLRIYRLSSLLLSMHC